jgi:hypothetical protein
MTDIKSNAATPHDTELVIYQTLITAQTSLASIKLDTDFLKQQEVTINTAIKAYNTAEAAFVLYVENANEKDISSLLPEVAAVAKEVTGLIATLIKPMDQQKVVEAKAHARFDVAHPAISLKTILGYLQMAAEVATVIPGASAWAGLASVVLEMVQKAMAAHQSATTVDVSKLHQLPLLG